MLRRWIGKDVERSRRGISEVLSWHLPRGTTENHQNPMRIADIPAEIRSEDLQKTNPERYL
jgi:hypothetical protein